MEADDGDIQSVWTRPQRRKREQPALTRAQIVDAAIELLASEGTEALSMRKLGAKLNAGATSLYTHVANKDEIVELAADKVIGELTVPDPAHPGGWRAAMREFATELRGLILRQPWLATVFGEIGTLYLGPNMMRSNEGMLTVLESAGFDEEQADDAMNVLFGYVIGVTAAEAASLAVIRRSGLDTADWLEKMLAAGEAASRPYPRMHKRYASRLDAAEVRMPADTFVKQIEMILDGLDPALRERA
ncbi:TetR/AcrR family transcriptional regulator [Nocardia sp. NPDC050713]|uniref:TetR/AcrR family transcriptional regulator n=1 Tax=Nocardia sp. NPDC050713 TaxID=3154511 RepID=UPI0033D5273B